MQKLFNSILCLKFKKSRGSLLASRRGSGVSGAPDQCIFLTELNQEKGNSQNIKDVLVPVLLYEGT